MNRININELLSEPLSHIKRPLAFWDWPDRTERDAFIACALLEELIYNQGWRIAERSVAGGPHPNKSPDVVARLEDDRTIALELTEWVNEKHLKAMIEGRRSDPPVFSDEETCQGIHACIDRKRMKILVGGPYDLRVLVIHTDQGLVPESAWDALQFSYPASVLAPWDQAYVVMPPLVGLEMSRHPHCRCIQLHQTKDSAEPVHHNPETVA